MLQNNLHSKSTPSNRLKIAVLVSGNGSNLQVLIDAMQAGKLPIDIVGVISNKADAYALTRAKEANMATCVLSHVKDGEPFVPKDDTSSSDPQLNDGDAKFSVKKMGIKTFERHALHQLSDWQPDLIVLAGFMRVLGSDFIANAPAPMINLHPSLLPKFKGLDTHARAIDAGETYHGCSVHLVTAELDAGQVLTQAVMPMDSLQGQGNALNPENISPENLNSKNLNPDTLQQAVHELEHQLLPWTILLIAKQVLNLQNLDEGLIPLPLRLWFE